MPYNLGKDKVLSALICESIRPELGNKFSVLGVFVGDLHVTTLPATIMLSCFMEYVPAKTGAQQLLARFLHNGKVVANINGSLDVHIPGEAVAIGLPTVPLVIDAPGMIGFEVSTDDKKWVLVTERKLILDPVATSPIASPPPLARSPRASRAKAKKP